MKNPYVAPPLAGRSQYGRRVCVEPITCKRALRQFVAVVLAGVLFVGCSRSGSDESAASSPAENSSAASSASQGVAAASSPEEVWTGFVNSMREKNFPAAFKQLTPESQDMLIGLTLLEIVFKKAFAGPNAVPSDEDKKVLAVLEKHGISLEPGQSSEEALGKVADKSRLFQELMEAKSDTGNWDEFLSDMPSGAVTGLTINGDSASAKVSGEDIYFKRVSNVWLVDLAAVAKAEMPELGGFTSPIETPSRTARRPISRVPTTMGEPQSSTGGASRFKCKENLVSLGFAMRVWARAHGDAFLFNVPTSKGGTLELCQPGDDGFDANSFRHFQALANQLDNPQVLVCPADNSRTASASFGALNPSSATYLIRSGTSLSENSPREVLAQCPIHDLKLRCDGSVIDTFAEEAELKSASAGVRLAKEPFTPSQALQFEGQNDWLQLLPIAWDSLQEFTVEAWIRDWKGIFLSQGQDDNSENFLRVSFEPNDTANLTASSGWRSRSGTKAVFTAELPPAGQWTHVALVFDGKNQLFFVNGRLQHRAAATAPGRIDNKYRLLIGMAAGTGSNDHGSGLLSAVRISSAARYQSNFQPLGEWSKDTPTLVLLDPRYQAGERIADLSGFGRHAEAHGIKRVAAN